MGFCLFFLRHFRILGLHGIGVLFSFVFNFFLWRLVVRKWVGSSSWVLLRVSLCHVEAVSASVSRQRSCLVVHWSKLSSVKISFFCNIVPCDVSTVVGISWFSFSFPGLISWMLFSLWSRVPRGVPHCKGGIYCPLDWVGSWTRSWSTRIAQCTVYPLCSGIV